jgi:hypothetical protein
VEPFRYELGVDLSGALNFFLHSLKEETSALDVREDELLYVASVLAHFANTSTGSAADFPSPSHLGQLFDRYCMLQQPELLPDSVEILERGGSESLFLAGFFREQMRRRYDLSLFDGLGRALYSRASYCSKNTAQAKVLWRISRSFRTWAHICRDLNATLQKNAPNPYLLRFN